MEVETGQGATTTTNMNNNVMCRLADLEGTSLGAAMYLSQNIGPNQLQLIVNDLLNNEEKRPYAFYISDKELVESLETYLQKNKVSVEKVLTIVYQPQAVFRIHPVRRCSATIRGHTSEVLAVSFSPDGKQLASGSGNATVRLWDLSTQTPLLACRGHTMSVLCVSWSPDGKHLVSGSKAGELRCWDPQTGSGHLIGSVSSSVQKFLRPCTKIKKSRLVKAGSKTPASCVTQKFKGHTGFITCISWEPLHLSAPCRRFVSSSKDHQARIWDINTRKCLICLSGHTSSVTCVKWGGDGFVYTGSQDSTIKVWETREEKLGELKHTLKGHGSWINSLALSTEYVLRTGAFDHTGKQYQSPEEMKKVALEKYNKMKGDGPERLVSGSDNFTMFLWENPSLNEHSKIRMTGHQQIVNHVYFSPDGQWVASASLDSWSADSRLLLSCSMDSTLKVWDIQTRKLKQDLPGHAAQVFAIDWSPDGKKVASGGGEQVLKLWMG